MDDAMATSITTLDRAEYARAMIRRKRQTISVDEIRLDLYQKATGIAGWRRLDDEGGGRRSALGAGQNPACPMAPAANSGLSGAVRIERLSGSRSNATPRVHAPDINLVLRIKPPDQTLPGADAVDREYRVLDRFRVENDVDTTTASYQHKGATL
ncbi:MAG: hypothetical protein M9939_21325 [Mesorhizobium sp.]|nr:hypothetical protein [Mesorhizobium sp.]MCO5163675.1 hypothetical protein [Mesorhizobium sp.]